MRKSTMLVAVLVLVLAAVLAGCGGYGSAPSSGSTGSTGSGSSTGGGTTGGSKEVAVSISNFAFSPSSADVAVGGTVTWTNNDSVAHTVTFDSGGDSGKIDPGKTFSKKFDTAGAFSYHCSIHPSMTGSITVK